MLFKCSVTLKQVENILLKLNLHFVDHLVIYINELLDIRCLLVGLSKYHI